MSLVGLIVVVFLILVSITFSLHLIKERKGYNQFTYRFNDAHSQETFITIKESIVRSFTHFNELSIEKYNSKEIRDDIVKDIDNLSKMPKCFKEFHRWDNKHLNGILSSMNTIKSHLEEDMQYDEDKAISESTRNKLSIIKSLYSDLKKLLENVNNKVTYRFQKADQ